MYASVFLAATGVVAIGSVWFLVRPRLARNEDKLSAASRWQEESDRVAQLPAAMPTHRAVSICPGPFSCEVARQHEDKPFLSGEAPFLPLTECDQATCECTYEHHDDRRGDEDRRNTYAAYSGFDPMQDKEDRRIRKERRER